MNVLELIAGPVMKIIDKIIPDPQAKAQAQLQVLQMQQAGEFKELDAQLERDKAQADVNKVEAGSSDKFTSRWRPFIGWVCGAGLAIQFIVRPLFTWVATLVGHPVEFPSLDMGTLVTLLVGMLGLGTLRTKEKLEGVA